MFLNFQELSCIARRLLDLPRVVELGVRRVVYLHVARLNLSRFFRLRGLPRYWENSYPVVLAVKDRANNPYHLVSERQVDHHKGGCPVEDRSAG